MTLENNLPPSVFLPIQIMQEEINKVPATNIAQEITAIDIVNAPIIMMPNNMDFEPTQNDSKNNNNLVYNALQQSCPQLHRIYNNGPLTLYRQNEVKLDPIETQIIEINNDEINSEINGEHQTIKTVPYFPVIAKKELISPPPLLVYRTNVEVFNDMTLAAVNQNNNNNIISYQIENQVKYSKWPEFSPQYPYSNDNLYAVENFRGTETQSRKRKHQKKDERRTAKKMKMKSIAVKSERRQTNYITTRSRFQSDGSNDEDPLKKRNIHNCMERQRRIGLKNLFVELKRQIPDLDDKDRVPKVSILRAATDFCRKLLSDEVELKTLKKNHARLIKQYEKLACH